jgi:hypothetical protein
MVKAFQVIFEEPPQWGLRGDPFLWEELKSDFVDSEFIWDKDNFSEFLKSFFCKATGYPISHTEDIFLERFDRGGMSSGMISVNFWRTTAFPLLEKRFADSIGSKQKSEQASAGNRHPCGTSVMPPAAAGDTPEASGDS